MKEELLSTYKVRQSEFISIRATYPEIDMAGPLLLSPNEKYAEQPFPFLVIGQETNGWVYYLDDLPKQMEVYEQFNVGINYRSTPFWNMTRKIENLLGNEAHSCAWTNISKFDVNGGRAKGEQADLISSLDNIVVSEIEILKPKFCMFFTGPSFDSRIRKVFQGLEMELIDGFSLNQLCKLKHKDLPDMTFRSYHPSYLRRTGIEDKVLQFIGTVTK